MSKNKQLKLKIAKLLEDSKQNPHGVINTLKSLQKGKRNTPTYQKIQNLINAVSENQTQQRAASYSKYAQQYEIDIPAESKKNVNALRQRVAKLYDVEAIKKYRAIWYQSIVPQFTLKHVTRDLKSIVRRGYLMSLNKREEEFDTPTIKHTRGSSAKTDHVYFTLGLKEHETVQYWKDKPDLITFKLGEAYLRKKNCLTGLWIGSHISPQVADGHLPSKYFGETCRTVSYNHELGKKITTYRYNDGKVLTIERSRDEDIFSAEENIEEIFDGLFYQILEEIHYLSGSYHAALTQTPAEILRQSMLHFYIPDVYPEAKVASGMVAINQPDVSLSTLKQVDGALIKKLSDHIKDNNFDEIVSILNEHPELINAKDSDCPFLLIFIKKLLCSDGIECEFWRNLVHLVLLLGADINGADFNKTAFSMLLCSKKQEAFKLLEKLLIGIPDKNCPLIRHTVNLLGMQRQEMSLSLAAPLELALEAGNWEAFLLLQKYGVKVNPMAPLIYRAYCGQLHDKILVLRDEYRADCNAKTASGRTALQYAAEQDDATLIHFLKANFADLQIDLIYESKRSALHNAVIKCSINAVNALLDIGADPKLIDSTGRTAYDYSVALQGQTAQQIVGYKFHGLKGTPLYDAQVKSEYDRVVAAYKTIEQNMVNKGAAIKINPTLVATFEHLAAAALVTRQNLEGRIEVLFIRKKRISGKPAKRFLFPGGYKDEADMSAEHTAARECFEETGLRTKAQPFYRYGQGGLEVTVCKAELINSHNNCPVANDDAAEAVWIDWALVKKKQTSSSVLFSYDGILIETSNALLVEAAIGNTLEQYRTKIDEEMARWFNTKRTLVESFVAGDMTAFKELVNNSGMNVDEIPLAVLSIETNSLEWLKLAIDLGADLDLSYERPQTFDRFTALTLAILRGKFDEAKLLIASGANVNLMIDKRNALIAACQARPSPQSLEFIRYLLVEKQVKLSEDIASIAIIYALLLKNVAAARLILDHDADEEIDVNRSYNITSLGSESTLLIAALNSEDFSVFSSLFNSRFDPRNPVHFSVKNYIECSISQEATSFGIPNLDAPGANRFTLFPQEEKEIEIDRVIFKVHARKLLMKKLNLKEAPSRDSFFDTTYKPTMIIKREGGEREVLVLRNYSAKSTPWYLPDARCLSARNLALSDFYTFNTGSNMVRGCNYKVLEFDDAKHSVLVDELSKDCAVSWLDINDIVKSNGYYRYKNSALCASDAIVMQSFICDKDIEDERVLDTAIFCKIYMTELLVSAYRKDNRNDFRHLVNLGADLNRPIEYRKPKSALGNAPILYFDLKYHSGRWLDFLLSLGADVNYYNSDYGAQLPLCTAIYEEDYALARKLMELGAKVDLKLNKICALDLLQDCTDEEFKQYLLEQQNLTSVGLSC